MAGWKFKRFLLAGLSLLVAILLVGCNRPIDDEIGYYLAHGPTSLRTVRRNGTVLHGTRRNSAGDTGQCPSAARYREIQRRRS